MIDPIIDSSAEQKRMRVDRLRIELFDLGFSVVTTAWLHNETNTSASDRIPFEASPAASSDRAPPSAGIP